MTTATMSLDSSLSYASKRKGGTIHLQLHLNRLSQPPGSASFVRLARDGSRTPTTGARVTTSSPGCVLVTDLPLNADATGTYTVEIQLGQDGALTPVPARIVLDPRIPVALLLGPRPASRVRPTMRRPNARAQEDMPALGRLQERALPAAYVAASRAGRVADRALSRLPEPAAGPSRRVLRRATRWLTR